MDTLLRDLRHAFRLLGRNPGFTIVAVSALALGIGANTAVFSVVNRILLQPLPYSEPERLVRMVLTYREGQSQAASVPKFMAWKNNTNAFQYMCAYDFGGPGLNLSGTSMPEQVQGL